MQGTANLSIQAGKWMSLGIVIQKFLSLATFIALSRLLLPEDFGFISIIAIMPATLDLVTSFNFESTLIHKKTDPEPYLNQIWTFNLLKSIIIVFIVAISAPLIINFFNLPLEKIWLARLSGLLILVPNIANVGQFYLFRDLDFKKIFIRDMSSAFAYSISTISLCLILHSYWALFIGLIIQNIVGVTFSYFLHPYRPRISYHFGRLKSLLGYSQWIYGQAIIGQIGSAIESSVVGKFTGPSNLGLYIKAKGLAISPLSPVSTIIKKVGFPAFARIQNSNEKITEGGVRSLDLLFLLTIPFVSAILFGGKEIVLFLLGPNWVAMTEVLKIMVIALSLSTLSVTITDPLFNGIGLSKIQFKIRLVHTTTFILCLIILAPQYGITGAAYSALLSSLIILVYYSYLLRNYLKHISFKRLFVSLLSVLLSTVITSLLGIYLKNVLPIEKSVVFILTGFLLGSIYLSLTYLNFKLWKVGPWETIIFTFQPIKQSLKYLKRWPR